MKFTVLESLGLKCSVVLPRCSPLSVLCSVLQLLVMAGNRFVNIWGRTLRNLGSGRLVGWLVVATALLIGVLRMLPTDVYS